MQTPYEIDGVKSTRAEGEQFLIDLAAANASVTLSNIGSSVNGNPMTAVKIGSGPVKVCVIASIHGSEPAPRDAAFKYIRDLAETTDPALLTYLASNAWAFVPTANPDRIDSNTRNNVNNIDLNRDYDDLTQPETQAIAAWLTACAPVLVLDIHETTNTAIPDTAIAISTHSGVHPSLTAQANVLHDVEEAALVAAGNGVVPYPFDTATTGTALTEAGRVWKATALTFETRNGNSKTYAQRVDEHMIFLQTGRSHHQADAADYVTAQNEAKGIEEPPPPPPPAGDMTAIDYRVRLNGVTMQPLMLKLRRAGETQTIWTKEEAL